MCSFWLVVLSLWLVGCARGGDVARCSNGTEYSLTLAQSRDELAGRYTARLCSPVQPEYTHWRLELSELNQSRCDSYTGVFVHGKILARHEEEFVKDGNCSYVCLETYFDMMSSGCYGLQSTFITTKGLLRQIRHKYEIIKNNYTNEDFKKNNNPTIHVTYLDEENATIEYHIGAPFKSFEVKICEINNSSVNSSEVELAGCQPVDSSCSARSDVEVRCAARLRAPCHSFELLLRGDWSLGKFYEHGRSTYTNCRAAGAVPRASGSVAAWRWAGGVLGALAAAAVLARVAAGLLARLKEQRARGKHVLRGWIEAVYSSEPGGGAGAGAGGGGAAPRHILLLYAREGAAGARVAAALRDLLLAVEGTQVYDIFSAEVMALAAGAPAEWARAMLQRDDVAVLLLQTPALQALYHTHHPAPNATEAPLLGRRVQYRVPAYGDQLLQYLVRYIADNVQLHHHYRRLYLATLSELATDMFPHVVPFRRYPLPEAGATLLEHLCPGAVCDPAPLAALAAAARQFADTATDHPDYLMDEIVLI